MLPIQKHALKALAGRGFKSAFESPTAYVALIVFYLLTGYFFALPLFLMGQASIKSLTDFVPLLFSFLVPALTMGLLSDEIKSGTFELLATMPLEDWDIVLGKYLGFSALLILTMIGLIFYPLTLSMLTPIPFSLDWGETFGVLSGLTLLGLMFGSAGLLASALSRSQIVSFVTAFLICFVLFAADKLSGFAPAPLSRIIEFIGIDSHLRTLSKGVFDTRDLLYFASMTFAFLHLAVQRLRTRKL